MRVLFPLAALFAFAPAANADDAADARAIVEKGVKAAGMKPDDKTKAMTWKEKGKFTSGDIAFDYTSDFSFQGPDRFRFVMNGEFGGMKIVFTLVGNGAKAWESGFGMTQESSGDKLDSTLNKMYQLTVVSLLPLVSEKEYKLATAGEKDVGGKMAVGVKVTRDKKPTITLFFDKDTSLLVKCEMKVKDEFQGWKDVPEESYFSEYKEVNGRKLFLKLKIVRDGKTMIESTLHDQKIADKLDAKLFEKP